MKRILSSLAATIALATPALASEFGTLETDNFTAHLTTSHCAAHPELYFGYVIKNVDQELAFTICYDVLVDEHVLHLISDEAHVDIVVPTDAIKVDVVKLLKRM